MDKSISSPRNSPNIEYFIYEASSDLGIKNENSYIGSRVEEITVEGNKKLAVIFYKIRNPDTKNNLHGAETVSYSFKKSFNSPGMLTTFEEATKFTKHHISLYLQSLGLSHDDIENSLSAINKSEKINIKEGGFSSNSSFSNLVDAYNFEYGVAINTKMNICETVQGEFGNYKSTSWFNNQRSIEKEKKSNKRASVKNKEKTDKTFSFMNFLSKSKKPKIQNPTKIDTKISEKSLMLMNSPEDNPDATYLGSDYEESYGTENEDYDVEEKPQPRLDKKQDKVEKQEKIDDNKKQDSSTLPPKINNLDLNNSFIIDYQSSEDDDSFKT